MYTWYVWTKHFISMFYFCQSFKWLQNCLEGVWIVVYGYIFLSFNAALCLYNKCVVILWSSENRAL